MTSPAVPPRTAYRDALIAARRTMFRLDARAALRISEAIRTFADDLARGVTAGPESESARRAALIARRASLRLDVAIAQAIQEGRDLTIPDVLAHWRRAMEEVAATGGGTRRSRDFLVGDITLATIALATIAALAGRTAWRTVLRWHVLNAEQEAAGLIREALTRGMAPDDLARRLRRYVVGAEEFRRAFPDLDPADLRGVSREAQQAARRMRYNAERIAFSEIGNARREAELQHFAADPFVRAIRWTLTAGVRTTDVCDVLAVGDFYGLGPGLYPVRRVPPVPHPWDRCEMVPVLFPSAESGSPKPSPARIRSAFGVAVPGEDRLTPLGRERIHEQAQELLVASEG